MEEGKMTTRRRHRKQQERLLETLIITAIIAMCVMLILGVGHIYVGSKIYKNQHTVEALSKELEGLESQVNDTKGKQDEYKKQFEQLQSQLAKYQDIVIPDSMK